MLIGLRNQETNELVYKDMLDIDFDMSIQKDNASNKYEIIINDIFKYKDSFSKRSDAEIEMGNIADSRNSQEITLANY